MAELSLWVLGSFKAELGNEPLTEFRTNKVRALLIYLATEQEPHSRESLLNLLWPGLPVRSARANLRQITYYLRKDIPVVTGDIEGNGDGSLLVANRQAIGLSPDAQVKLDVTQFEAHLDRSVQHEHLDLFTCTNCRQDLEMAAGLYRGNFLEDIYLDDSNEFEEWAQIRREIYRRKVLDALETLTTITTRQQEYSQARNYAERQMEIDNLRESAYRQMMEIMALSGQRTEALTVYENCRRLLAEELGMAPSKRTTEIYEKILAGELTFDMPMFQGVRGYELKDEIGEGAYGSIHRAVQPSVGREVAVKVIRRKYANDPEFIRRFEAEAHTIARLEHPFIVPLYDYWREPDGAYLVMRYLKGGNLLSILRAGPWGPDLAGKMLNQIASALSAAHQQGVVHRDIKPANILLDEAGNAYLSDFGIAKNLTDDVQLTREGAVIGTFDYVSPEQIRNDPVTAQTDVYSLGAVLYETLTGEKPYPDSSVSNLIYKHLNEPVPLVSASRPDLPPQVDEVIQRATAKQPADRYADAMEMAKAFRAAVQGIDTDLVSVEPTFAPVVPEVYNPYKGLRAFQEADADDFFGREALVDQLITRLGKTRFLAVVGPSGSGKSSAVKAGLIPALQQGALPGSRKWFMAEMVPGTHPLEELELALWPIAVDPPPSLVEPMERDTRGMLRTIRRIMPEEDDAQLLLVIDQFEEVFTLVDDAERRDFFIDSLLTAIRAPRTPLRVVITLRADFYDRPLRIESLGKLLKENTEIALPLSVEELTWAVRQPSRRVGVSMESGLAEIIVSDVSDQPGALPLLQYALTELFEKRQNGAMTREAYDEIGGVLSALGRRAEEIFDKLDLIGQDAARQIFLRLVTLGEGVEDTRRRVLRSELEAVTTDSEPSLSDHDEPAPSPQSPTPSPQPLVPSIIDQFGAARLLTFDRDPTTRAPTVEVAHEALLREWGRLREWLDESRGDVRMERLLATGTAEWMAADKDPGFLLREARLNQFAGWAETSTVALTGDEEALLRASVSAREARQAEEEARRQRELETAQNLAETEHARAEEQAQAAGRLRRRAVLLAGALAVALVLAVVAVVFARQADSERQNSQRQAAILLADQAITELEDGNYDRAVLLALDALENHPYTTQAESALGQVVSYNRSLQQYTGHDSAVTSADWSPDGEKIATTSTDNKVHVWDATTAEELLVIDLPEGISGSQIDMGLTVKWTPDGNLLTMTGDRYLVGSQDYGIQMWDSNSSEQLFALEIPNDAEPEQGDLGTSATHYATGASAEFGPKSGRLATLGGDNTAIIWDEIQETQQMVLEGHENDVNGIAWSSDERTIATASEDGTVRIWDSATGNNLHILDGQGERVNVVAWSPDGAQLASAGSDGIVRFWNPESGETNGTIATNAGVIWSLVWSPDGERLLTGHDDSLIRIWDVQSGQLEEILGGHSGIISHLAWSPTNNQLASTDGNGEVRTWNVAPRTAALSLPYQVTFDPSWSSDGQFIAYVGGDVFTGSELPFFDIWDVEAARPVVENLGASLGYYWWDAEYSKDDTLLLARGQKDIWPDAPVTVQVIDARTGEVVKSFSPSSLEENEFLRDTAWSPDDSQVAAATLMGNVFIWDYESGALLNTMQHSPAVIEVEWSPDGSKFVTAGSDSRAVVWDAMTWELLFSLEGHEPPAEVSSVEWSPDGSRILTVSGNPDLGAPDTTARIWDGDTGEELLVIDGHAAAVWFGEWSPDGKRVVTSSMDGTTRIWDATSGDELLNLSTPSDYAPFVTWSPTGQHIAVGGYNMAAEVWRVWQTPEELIEYTRECCVFRELTPEEREQFGLTDQ